MPSIQILHQKIYANSTPFVWSNKNCNKCRLFYWIKAFFACLEVPFPFNTSYFLTQIPTNKWRVIKLEMNTFILNYFFSLWWNKKQLNFLTFFWIYLVAWPFHCLIDYIWKCSLTIIGYFSYKRYAKLIHKFRFISTKDSFIQFKWSNNI